MLHAFLKRYRQRAANVDTSSTRQTMEEKMDITVRNSLTLKFTNFYKVDSQLAAILCACGLAQPYAKPAPAPTTTTFWVEASTHTGAMGLHYRKPSGEVVTTFNVGVPKAVLQAAWGAEIPAPVWETFLAKSKAAGNAQ